MFTSRFFYFIMIRHLIILFCLVQFYGCSGSEPDGPSGAEVASINLGPDITVLEGQAFTLTATVYPDEGAISWVQTKGPSFEDFPPDPALEVTLVAPPITIDSLIVMQVTYTTTDGQRVQDEININVTDVNEPPVSVIVNTTETLAPYKTFDIVTLTAQNSEDPDGEIRAYRWTQVDENPPLQFLTSTNLREVSFQAPFVTAITNYKIELKVTDNFGLTATNIIDIQIAAAEGTVATEAGQDQDVDEFTRVTLDASDSVSVDNVLSCSWTQLTGIPVELENADSCIAYFFAPNVDSTELLTFQVEAVDNNNNSESDTVNITVNPLNFGSLHDTGVIECYSDSAVIPCGDSDYTEQDADNGRDSVRDAIDKSGAGDKTFDFTKFDKNGDEIPDESQAFSCVRDNFTGLIWEVKVGNANPQFSETRGVENYYSKDDSLPGVASCGNPSNCGVETYISQINTETYCGGANWRLPTYLELMQILDYGDLDQENLFPDEFFPYSPNPAALNHLFYWVSESNPEGGGESFEWVIDVRNGDDSAVTPQTGAYVRLVRTP